MFKGVDIKRDVTYRDMSFTLDLTLTRGHACTGSYGAGFDSC